jgi:hypothetical protein
MLKYVVVPVQTVAAIFIDSLQRLHCLYCAYCVFVWCICPHLYLLSELLVPNYPYVRILNIVAPRKISYTPPKLYGVKYQDGIYHSSKSYNCSQITTGDRHKVVDWELGNFVFIFQQNATL